MYLLGAIIPFRESKDIELKQSLEIRFKKKYSETINAFVNSGGGKIIFGISDNGYVKGIPLSRKEEDDWLRWFDDQLKTMIPQYHNWSIRPQKYRISVNLNVWEIEVVVTEKLPTLVSLITGDTFIRRNASNNRVKNDKYYSENEMKLLQIRIDDLERTVLTYNKVISDFSKICFKDNDVDNRNGCLTRVKRYFNFWI